LWYNFNLIFRFSTLVASNIKMDLLYNLSGLNPPLKGAWGCY
jgi:hypothetical protein